MGNDRCGRATEPVAAGAIARDQVCGDQSRQRDPEPIGVDPEDARRLHESADRSARRPEGGKEVQEEALGGGLHRPEYYISWQVEAIPVMSIRSPKGRLS